MKQLIENRYIGAKVGDTIGVVDRKGFIAPDDGGGGESPKLSKIIYIPAITVNEPRLEIQNVN